MKALRVCGGGAVLERTSSRVGWGRRDGALSWGLWAMLELCLGGGCSCCSCCGCCCGFGGDVCADEDEDVDDADDEAEDGDSRVPSDSEEEGDRDREEEEELGEDSWGSLLMARIVFYSTRTSSVG